MANTKISQLPLYSGSAADLRYFVMNNSGETETFKFSGYSSPYRWVSSTSGVTEVNYTKSTQLNRQGGTNTETAGSYSNFIVGKGNTVGTSSKFYAIFGNDNTAIGGSGVGTEIGSLIFGQNNSHTGGAGSGVMIVGAYNSCSGNFATAFGVNMNVGGYYSLGGGNNNNISSSFSFAWGETNNLSGGDYQYSFGEDNDITTSSRSGIFGGLKNRITGTGNRNVILGSSASTINNLSDVVILGCNGFSATTSATTFVENLQVLRTPSTRVQPVQTGAVFTLDLNNGAKSRFVITGTSTINITNVRDGASFMVQTQTDGNYVNTWTATGGFTFLFEGGIKDPGNNVVDIFKFEVFNNVIYGSRAHNFV